MLVVLLCFSPLCSFEADLSLILELGWWPANPKEPPSISALDSTWILGTSVAMPGFLRAELEPSHLWNKCSYPLSDLFSP